jgi:para-nitrobenzyl esterase
MKYTFFGFLIFISLNCNAQLTISKVKTSDGILQGVIEGQSAVFKGIPFAAPPVGEFRWRPPQPVKKWSGVRDATKYAANPAQAGWGAKPGTIAEGSAEDCLYLNIWKPASATKNLKLPVMIWIYGGGFTGGSASSPQNYGTELNKNGVVLVNINYRVGRLGYFAHPALSSELPSEYKGNYGFMDQIAALKWVQKNIAAFGGDPNNVTIFGFSAGGVSVHSLLTIPSAKGLFHKAIGHSSGGRDGVLTGRPINKENADVFYKVSAETIGLNFAKKVGITGTGAAALAALRALPIANIVDGGQETDGPNGPRTHAGPIFDGKLVTETAESAYLAGRLPKIPLIIGNCSAEIGGAFVTNAKTKEELFASFGALEAEAKSAYDPDGKKEFNEVIAKFNTDWVWGEPARMTAKTFLAKGAPAYLFHFGYVPTAGQQRSPYGAGHGSDISFVFNTLGARWGGPGGEAPAITPEESELARIMCGYWTNFAKTGNPNGANLPNWPMYNNQTQDILDVELEGKVVAKSDPRKARLDVVEKGMKFKGKIQSRGI